MATASDDPFLVLVVDDEPDIHAVTKLALRSMRYRGRRLAFLEASSASECLRQLRAHPDIAVVLLDVVMEHDHAGLEACEAIRTSLGNAFTRILLRTGQPGMAPERKTIEDYDIDDYLPKADLSSDKLFTSVRTALKAWLQLVELERHRRSLRVVHDCALSLHAFDSLQENLTGILSAAIELCPTPLALLRLNTFSDDGDPRRVSLHQASATNDDGEGAADLFYRVGRHPAATSLTQPAEAEGGWLVPIHLHRELGDGWLYLSDVAPDELTQQSLALVAAHAANALYASVAQRMLEARDGPVFHEMAI